MKKKKRLMRLSAGVAAATYVTPGRVGRRGHVASGARRTTMSRLRKSFRAVNALCTS